MSDVLAEEEDTELTGASSAEIAALSLNRASRGPEMKGFNASKLIPTLGRSCRLFDSEIRFKFGRRVVGVAKRP